MFFLAKLGGELRHVMAWQIPITKAQWGQWKEKMPNTNTNKNTNAKWRSMVNKSGGRRRCQIHHGVWRPVSLNKDEVFLRTSTQYTTKQW